jgi:hypothetical protein
MVKVRVMVTCGGTQQGIVEPVKPTGNGKIKINRKNKRAPREVRKDD